MSDVKVPTWREAFLEPLITNNPVMIQILGICSTLAVTSSMKQRSLWVFP